jgi:6-phosphofructokinase 1
VVPLSVEMLLPWAGRGGSVLPSSRDPVLSQEDAGHHLRAILAAHQIDNLLLFGGNGTLRHIPPRLREWGIPVMGIPTTIDNDVPGTELTLGFDSACNFAYHAIDGACTTAHALRGRMFMVETLGGTCGNLALAVAEGAGAHAVILPEYAYSEDWLAARMKTMVEAQGYGLFVICEGSRGARTLAEELPKLTGIRMRDVRLGHAQRGGTASHRDRVLAAQMAGTAYRAFQEGVRFGVLVVRGGHLNVHTDPLPDAVILPDKAAYDRINGISS